MRLKRDEVESEEPPFLGLREVRVEDEAVGTRAAEALPMALAAALATAKRKRST